MYEVFTKLLNMSLMASILVLIIIVLRFALERAPKKFICILWALVALRLICPFSISSVFSAYNMLDKNTISSGQVEYFEYNEKTEKPQLTFEVPALVNDNYSPDSMTVGTKTSGVYMPTIVYIWLFGVFVMVAYALISYARLCKEVRASIKKDDNVYVCDEISSPFILGFIRPRIYLPSGISEEVREHVVAHEKAHIKRFDYIWKPLGFVLLSVYWFNPVMWIAYIFLCKDIEGACDEKVISQMDKESIASYSQALLTCAAQRRMITACPIAFGETDVKGRIKNVLNYKKPAFWIICISIVSCIVVAVCFLTNPKKDKNCEVPFGTYVKNDLSGDTMLYWSGLTINEDGTFTYSPSVISSYMGVGTWTIDGDYITFNDTGMGDVRKEVFKCIDGNLYYVAAKSASNSMWGLVDGSEYTLQAEDSFKETMYSNSEPETVDESDSDVSSEYAGIETKLFEEMSGEYWMLSGAGGWQSRIYLYSDGYFVGIFEDADAGSVERCEFSGYLEYPMYLNENTYLTHINELVYEEPGKVSEEDGIKLTTSTPYGFDGASTTYIYVPGTPISSLSNDEYFWVAAEREEFWDKSYEKAKDDVLPCFAIRNIDPDNLSEVDYMFSKVPEEYQSDLGSRGKRSFDVVEKSDNQSMKWDDFGFDCWPIADGQLRDEWSEETPFWQFTATKGTPVYAVKDGTVVGGYDYDDGNYVILSINDINNTYVKYCHLDTLYIDNSTFITAGTKIGTVGATGKATGPFLKVEIDTDPVRRKITDAEVISKAFSFAGISGKLTVDVTKEAITQPVVMEVLLQDSNGKIVWKTEVGIPSAGWNAYYVYSNNGTDYLIEYYPSVSQGLIAYSFIMYEFDVNGNAMIIDEQYASTSEEVADFIEYAKPYLEKAQLFISTIDGVVTTGI